METLGSYKTPEDKEDWLKTSTYVQAFKKAVVFITTKCAEKMISAVAEHGQAYKEAFDTKVGFLATKAAKLHGIQYVMTVFEESVNNFVDGVTKDALVNCFILFALDQLFENANLFVLSECLNSEQLKVLKDVYEEILEKVHVDAFRLIEAFEIPDILLQSTIGHSNGKVYENLLNMAKSQTTINSMDSVHPAMLEIIPRRNEGILKNSSLAKL